jgi:murein L,D-transpeptidase YcbB/YkuD
LTARPTKPRTETLACRASWRLRLGLLLTCLLAAIPVQADDSIADVLRAKLNLAESSQSRPPLDWPRLKEFYASRDYRPVWIDGNTPNRRADRWRVALTQADAEGLNPQEYHLAAIDGQWQTEDRIGLASLELLLTDAFIRYSAQAQAGRLDPGQVDPDWHIKPPSAERTPLAWLSLNAKDFGRAVATLPPPHPGYRALRSALARYRKLEDEGGWPVLPSGPILKLGYYDRQVGLLRLRLMAEGDLQTHAFANLDSFDLDVSEAVKRFQARHGLEPDGIVGPSTRAAMNVPVASRIEQIRLNMERWRWLPRTLGERYVMVNTAGYQLEVNDNGRATLAMRVIAGQKDKMTPVLGARLAAVQLNPYWFVPSDIAAEELLPEQKKNRKFFESMGYRVFNHWGDNAVELNLSGIKWWKYNKDNFPYKVRQDPGPQNALGRMKFIFQNNFAIYLHDTPQRRLFENENRALSHGCVRVEHPMQLALALLQGDDQWNQQAIEETIESGATVNLPLREPVPIYLVYWTAWVGDQGQMNFREDIYERDRRMTEKTQK